MTYRLPNSRKSNFATEPDLPPGVRASRVMITVGIVSRLSTKLLENWGK